MTGCAALGGVGLAILDGAAGGAAYKGVEHLLEKDDPQAKILMNCIRSFPDGGDLGPWMLCHDDDGTYMVLNSVLSCPVPDAGTPDAGVSPEVVAILRDMWSHAAESVRLTDQALNIDAGSLDLPHEPRLIPDWARIPGDVPR